MKKIILLIFIISSHTLTAQNVGIGTNTPLTKLHVYNGASGATPFLISPLTVESNGNTNINLLSPAANETGILFGIPVSPYHGGIVYNHVYTPRGLQLRTNGNVTRMVVDSAGNVGIGTQFPTARLSLVSAGTELAGTAMSNSFKTNAGNLGNTIGDEISIASLGFMGANNIALGIRGYRSTAGTDWTSTSILLGYDVDNTIRPASFFAMGSNGNFGFGAAAPVASAKLDVTSTTSGFLPPRMTSTQRDAISSAAEGLIIYNTTSKAVEFYNGTSWFGTTHYIGESYGGGIVFYVYENGQHGLIAAIADQSTGIQWYNGSFTNTNAIRDGIATTSYNTEHIIVNQGAGNYAAMVCAKYNGGGYGDWYLPSKYELNLLYLQKNLVGGFTIFSYWSSTEFNANNAWLQGFQNGVQTSDFKNNVLYVRAIRAF